MKFKVSSDGRIVKRLADVRNSPKFRESTKRTLGDWTTFSAYLASLQSWQALFGIARLTMITNQTISQQHSKPRTVCAHWSHGSACFFFGFKGELHFERDSEHSLGDPWRENQSQRQYRRTKWRNKPLRMTSSQNKRLVAAMWCTIEPCAGMLDRRKRASSVVWGPCTLVHA